VLSYKLSRSVYLHGDATAVGGRMQKPVEKFVPTVAPVSLPGVGGYTNSVHEEGFRFEETVSCKRAYSRVESDHHADGSASILLTSAVEELNILEVFAARRIVTQLTICVPPDRSDIGVCTIGTCYEGVRIAGFECLVEMTQGLQPLDRTPEGDSRSVTWSEVRAKGRTQAQTLLSSFKDRNESDAYEWAERKYGWLTTEPSGTARSLCSLVDSVKTAAPVRCHGSVIEIPHFGRITLGELVVTNDHVRLVGLRADLGCTVRGAITVCCEGGGGIGDN